MTLGRYHKVDPLFTTIDKVSGQTQLDSTFEVYGLASVTAATDNVALSRHGLQIELKASQSPAVKITTWVFLQRETARPLTVRQSRPLITRVLRRAVRAADDHSACFRDDGYADRWVTFLWPAV